MKRTICALIAIILTISAAACVLRPPLINLESLGTIGLVQLRSEAKGNITEFATQVLLEVILKSQPGTRIKELGREEEVLGDIGADRISPDSFAAIGRKYGLDAVILGTLEVSDVKPRVDLATIISTLSVSAEVDARMTARLVLLRDGTTIWTGSGRNRETVANVSLVKGGGIFFDARDPEEAYGPLVRNLVLKATRDFQWR